VKADGKEEESREAGVVRVVEDVFHGVRTG